MDKTKPVAILGGGTFGLSTALHLAESGYTSITVFERDETIPSQYSAGNDLNKIVRAEYEEDFYTDLVLDAIEKWKKLPFSPYYHQTGYIIATSDKAPEKSVRSLQKSLSSVSAKAEFEGDIHPLESAADFRKFAWQLTGPLRGFRGYFNRQAGYAHASNALKAIYHYCVIQGVQFILGTAKGRVESIRYDDSGQCIGVQTADGVMHAASQTICALGAHSATLIPSLQKFTIARAWPIVHIQLSQEEADLLRGMPVLNVRDLGFFFEPDPQTRMLKLSPNGAGVTNKCRNEYIPPTELRLPGFLTDEDEQKLRRLLQETFPWLADRPFIDKRLCWVSDTRDSEYCIDFAPGTRASLVVLAGDSGHGFKMMPIVGEWVLNLLRDGRQDIKRWRWRTEGQDGNWDDGVSWRIGKSRDIEELLAERDMVSKLPV